MLNNLLESSHRDDSNKGSNIGFGEKLKQAVSIEVNFKHLIWRSAIRLANGRKWEIKHLATSRYSNLGGLNRVNYDVFCKHSV